VACLSRSRLYIANYNKYKTGILILHTDTREGLEECFALSYYGRLRLISNLIPLLRKSTNPRVLSILNGTKEKRNKEDDIGLERNWNISDVVAHTTLLTSLAFNHLFENEVKWKFTFIHATPGFVNTGTARKTYPSLKDGYLWFAFLSVMQVVSGWIIRYFGINVFDSGERHAYLLTSDGIQPGSWRTNRHNDIVPDNTALAYYLQNGWKEMTWNHTVYTWDRALGTNVELKARQY
jgi:hypothetical protein